MKNLFEIISVWNQRSGEVYWTSRIWSTHLITPETENSTHYMFSFARNFSLPDEEMSKLLYEGSKATFLEDMEMLEGVDQSGRRLARGFDRHHY